MTIKKIITLGVIVDEEKAEEVSDSFREVTKQDPVETMFFADMEHEFLLAFLRRTGMEDLMRPTATATVASSEKPEETRERFFKAIRKANRGEIDEDQPIPGVHGKIEGSTEEEE